jgi:hypothetical protein
VSTEIPQVYTDTGWTTALWIVAAAGGLGAVIAVLMKSGRTPATGGRAPDADSVSDERISAVSG